MPIVVACPSCGARLKAPDAAAGKTVKCPKCGASMVIPPPPPPPPTQAGYEVIAPPPSAATTPEQQISNKLRQYEDEKNQEEYETSPFRTPQRRVGRYEETGPKYESDEEHYEVPARIRRPQRQSNWMAITGMIMGLLSIGFGCIPCGWFLGFLPSVLGIIFSGVGLAQALQVKTKPQPGKTMAITGLVTSILALVILPVVHLVILGAILSDTAERFEKNLKKEMDRIQKQIDRDIKKFEEEIDKDIKDFGKGINNPIISKPGGSTGRGSTGKSPSQNQKPPPQEPIYNVGQRAVAGDIALTVLKVQRVSSIDLDDTGLVVKADPGNVYLVLDVQIENINRSNASYNMIYFDLKQANGKNYRPQIVPIDNLLDAGFLSKGKGVRGKVIFEVEQSARGLVLVYRSLDIGSREIRISLN
ncbi:MAG: DUF4352 domain-containing protein [Thermogemmata sp.]|jgi:hypothetical protein